MNIRMGATFFADVDIPILWGSRAILRDKQGHLSVIEVEGDRLVVEVVDDQPAKATRFSATTDGFIVLDKEGVGLYAFHPKTRSMTSTRFQLPPVTVGLQELRVGTNAFAGNIVAGIGVGIVVTDSGIALGGPLPPSLAAL